MMFLKGLLYLNLLWYIGIPGANTKGVKDAVPFSLVEKVAVEEARALWNTESYGPVIPYVDFDGNVVAYLFTFKIGSSVFPPVSEIERERTEAELLIERARAKGDRDLLNRALSSYFGYKRYGSIVVGARYSRPPVIERGALLPRYYTVGKKALRRAEEYLGEEVLLTRIYYVGPPDKWYEFRGKSGRSVIVDPFSLKVYPAEKLQEFRPSEKGLSEFAALMRKKWEAVEKTDAGELLKSMDSGYVSGVPFYIWSYGCSPTTSAMLMGYWDSRGYGRLVDYYFDHWDVASNELVENVPNVQLELALGMFTDTITGGTTIYNIPYGHTYVANTINGYIFGAQVSPAGYQGNNWNWGWIVSEIDNGRPTHWAVLNYLYGGEYINHSVAAVGYSTDGSNYYVKVHNTWDYGEWDWDLSPNTNYESRVVTLVPGGADSNNIFLDFPHGGTPLYTSLPFVVSWTLTGTAGDYVNVYFSGDNAQSWTLVGNHVLPDETFSFAVEAATSDGRVKIELYNSSGQLLAADASEDNLIITSLSDTSHVTPLSFLSIGYPIYDIERIGDLLLAAGTDGLTVIDVSDNSDLSVLGFSESGDADNFIMVRDNMAYIASKTYGLRMVDFSDPENPQEVGHYSPGDQVLTVDLYGDYAILAARLQKLRVVDVSNPASPTEVSQYPDLTAAFAVDVVGNKAYVTSLSTGLHILDLSDINNIQELGSIATNGAPYDVVVSGNYAFIADGNGGVFIADVSNPASPQEVTAIDVPGMVKRVKIKGNYLFVLSDQAGFRVFDVSDPSSPAEVGHINVDPTITGFGFSSYYGYVATSDGCILALDMNCVGVEESDLLSPGVAFTLIPNPLTQKGSLRFSLRNSSRVEVNIYDASGRLLLPLYSGNLEAGEHVIPIDVGNLNSGIYFLRLNAGTFTKTGKLLIVR